MLKARTSAARARTLLVAFVCTLLAGIAIPAQAQAAATLSVSIVPVAANVLSGDDMVWRINWQCASTVDPCTGAKITVPVPPSNPTGIVPTNSSVTRDTNNWVATAAFVGTNAVWTFQSSVPAGSSGEMQMVLKSRNLMTPNGDTYSPVATFTASNAATVVSTTNSTVTVSSTPGVTITKVRYPSNGAPEPFPGTQVTYQITASNVEQYATAAPNGTESLANMIITDTLPPTATFVSGSRLDQMKDTVAPCTVSGQNASGQGGTVTCPPIDDPLGPTVNRTGQVAYITVTYPATQPAANTPANQADDGVTNSATVTAQPYGRPSVTVTASSAVTHGFRPVTGGGPGVSMAKGNNSQGIVYQGQSSVIWTNTMRNTGTAPLTVHWIDRMPCGYVSPTATTDPCPNLTDPVNSIQPNWGYRDVSRPAVVNVIYADGTTDTHSWSGVQTNATRAWSPAKPVAVMEWTVPLDPGESFGVSLLSTVKATLAVPNPDPANTAYVTNVSRTDGNTYLENCLSDTRYQLAGSSTWTNVTLAPVHGARCAVKQVLAASPLCNTNCSKTATNATQAPGGLVDFALRIQNTGNADMKPQFLDLLPPQLKVKPGSVVIPVGTATTPTRATANIEILDNYADTGRQLLRITWPDTQVLAVGTGTYTVTFQGIVQGGHAAGLYTNTVVYGDKDRVDICVVGNRVTDIYDLDGDGSTTDNQCKASGNFTIAGLAGIDLTKSVKGAADSDFKTTPTVGNAGTAMTGTYKLELKNSGSVDLKQTVFYDILPWVGDQAIGPATGPRDTAWTARSVSVNAPSGAVVQYSQSTNPCRGDLILGQAMTSGPAGCVNDWSNTAPTDLSLLKPPHG